MQATADALHRAIDADVESPWDALTILADWYDDNGEPGLARAYRWFVEEQKVPYWNEYYSAWRWWILWGPGSVGERSNPNNTKHRLPAKSYWTLVNGYSQPSAAYIAAASEIIKPEYELTHNTKGSK